MAKFLDRQNLPGTDRIDGAIHDARNVIERKPVDRAEDEDQSLFLRQLFQGVVNMPVELRAARLVGLAVRHVGTQVREAFFPLSCAQAPRLLLPTTRLQPDHSCDAEQVGWEGAGGLISLPNLPDPKESLLRQISGEAVVPRQAVEEAEEGLLILVEERLEGRLISTTYRHHQHDILLRRSFFYGPSYHTGDTMAL